MTETQQRVSIGAIFGQHGWRGDEQQRNCDICGKNPPHERHYVPDYPNDLNAMREVISKSLSTEQRKALRAVVWQLSDQMDPLPPASVFAKAFLIVIGKWVE